MLLRRTAEELKSFLQNQKCDVAMAADGESAVRCCLQMQPDLVLLHDSLPDIGSFELCRLMKKDPLTQLTPVVLLNPPRISGTFIVDGKPAQLISGLRLHSEHLTAYVEQLGESLGFGEEDLQELRIASWLHDIGKIGVPESILLKPGPLNAEERRIMQEHPVIGENICKPLKSLRRILPVIRHHHEKMDGSGYPDGLRGEAIPLKARILQIADIYDALTTNRPYRGALPPEEALQTLYTEAGNGWLDASVVLKFSQICREGEYFPVRGRTMLASYYA